MSVARSVRSQEAIARTEALGPSILVPRTVQTGTAHTKHTNNKTADLLRPRCKPSVERRTRSAAEEPRVSAAQRLSGSAAQRLSGCRDASAWLAWLAWLGACQAVGNLPLPSP